MKTSPSKSTPAQQPSTTSFFDQQKSEGQFFGEQQNETDSESFFPIQTKLSIGSPNDQYEKEADANADRVVNEITNPDHSQHQVSNTSSPIQRKCTACESTGKPEIQRKPIFESDGEPNVQMKCAACGNDLDVQTKSDNTDTTDSGNLSQGLNDSKGKGSALPDDTRNSMESSMGADFSNVRVHDDEKANQMNEGLGAQAFTHGSDIYFNNGKYNPSTNEGQHLLAHELTHTVQQGAAPTTPNIQKDEDDSIDTNPQRPNTALDITQRFAPDEAWATYLEANRTNTEVDVVIGNDYEGTLIINQTLAPQEGRAGKYDLSRNRRLQYLTVKGMSFLNPMKESGVEPILVLRNFGDDQLTTGFLSVKIGEEAIGDVVGLIRGFNERMEAMSFIGLDQFTLPGADIENTFEQGRLIFSIPALSTTVDGFLTASVGVGIVGNSLTFDLSADVDIEGLASGEFTMSRDESGQLSGRATISGDIANVQATIMVEYIAGVVTIQGTGRMESEKFSGEVTLLVTDRNRANEMMHAALGVNVMDSEAETPESPPAPKTTENQVLVGWGEVTASITPWLEGTAKIGIDSEGHVTVVGEIVVPDEIELMEQRGKKIQLIDFEVRVGYGVPLVGQVFVFGGIGLFINAGFGPLVLRDIRFTGTYSTDPNILQEFSITGALGINAFAVLGLEAEAGVGVTLLGHDVKAGINATAAAGLRAYAEARPTFEYVESQAPEGGKVGEAFLRGHFEAAAQLFLMLSGAFFVELDSPWWSPAPDDRWEYPLGSVEYPIGDSMGIGADVEWLVGSPDIPELAFTPVEFDPEKFTADVMADPPPGRGGGDADEQGDWNDATGGGNLEENPNVEEGGEGLDGRNQQDLTQLPDEEKYMLALSEVSDIAEDTSGTPPTERVLTTKLNRIKSRYAVSTIRIDETNDDHALVYVAHARENNRNNLVRVSIMSEAERARLMTAAMAAFERLLDGRVDDEGKLLRTDADSIADQIADDHTVIESIRVVDGGERWDFQMDIGDRDERVPGRRKAEGDDVELEDFAIEEPVSMESESHTLIITANNGDLELVLRSDPKILKPTLRRILNEIPGNHPDREVIQLAYNEVNGLELEFEANANDLIRGVRGDVQKIKKDYVKSRQAAIANQLHLIATTFGITELDDFFRAPPSERYIPRRSQTDIGRFIRQKLYDNMHGWSSFSSNYESTNRGTLIDEVLAVQNSNNHNRWQSLKEQGKVDPDADISTYNPNSISRYHVDHITPVAELWSSEGFNVSDSDRRAHFLDEDNLQLMAPRANLAKNSGGVNYKKFVGPNFISSIAGGGIINSSVIDGTSFWDANQQPI